MQAMEISRTGMDVEWRRLEVIADNLANANTVLTATGAAYQPRRLISGPRGDFAALLNAAAPDGGKSAGRISGGVAVYSIEAVSAPPRMVREPANPQANEKGFVAYPAIDHAAEMTLMVKTSRVYEANIVAMNMARQMYSKALELGRRA